MKSELIIARNSGTELPMKAYVVATQAHIAQLEGEVGGRKTSQLHTHALASDEAVPSSVIEQAEMLVLQIDPSSEASLSRFEQVRHLRPDLPVLAAVEDANLRLVRTLLRQGVTDVVALPFDFEELFTQVIEATASRSTSAMDRLAPMASVVHAVGGAGATTVLTHLAAAIAENGACGSRVCIVDLDLQFGEVATQLGLSPQHSVLDLLEAGERLDGDVIRDSAVETRQGNFVIAAPPQITPLEDVDVDRLLRMLTLARREFDYVLVDLPVNWTNWSLSAALACSEMIMLTDQSIRGLRQTKRCLELFDMMDVPRDNLRLVVNRVEKKMFQSIGVHEVADTLHRQISATIAKDKVGLDSAQDQGLLLTELNRKAPFVKDIQKLADQMCDRQQEQG
ncbi:AAA family ATPase [Croceicoccus mobilis]|nr:AAA family ATPase [Croceicoccus mobilis]